MPQLIDLHEAIPDLTLDIRYAGPNNFIGERINGYDAAKALLLEAAAEALSQVQTRLKSRGLALKIFDAYRPQRAVDHFLTWCADPTDQQKKAEYYPNIDKSMLFSEGYLVEQSSHSRGSTVDLTVISLENDNQALDMGTCFDFFDTKSWALSTDISSTAQHNRTLLRSEMMKQGFQPFKTEWWHFTLNNEPFPSTYFDIPII